MVEGVQQGPVLVGTFFTRAWRGEAHRWRAQRGCRWSRTALATPG